MSIDGNRLNLKEIKKSGAHQRAKSLVENVRAICFAG